jgi:hypothetical protein
MKNKMSVDLINRSFIKLIAFFHFSVMVKSQIDLSKEFCPDPYDSLMSKNSSFFSLAYYIVRGTKTTVRTFKHSLTVRPQWMNMLRETKHSIVILLLKWGGLWCFACSHSFH